MEELMRHNLDQSNIVKLHDWYHMNHITGLVLEMLDMSLSDYMKEDHLPLKDIRLIVQQVPVCMQKATQVKDKTVSGKLLKAVLNCCYCLYTYSWPQHWMD